MKSLKKVAVIGALLSTMNFAKAEEKVFAPTDYEGGEIDKIELVNGQLLVRSNGKMDGIEMPYAYVGTNTQHFAENAFAQSGLTNVANYVHAGNGKIYMTEEGNTSDVWTTTVGAPGSALNGVKQGVEAVNLENDPTAKALLENIRANQAAAASTEPTTITNASTKIELSFMDDGQRYAVVDDGVRKVEEDGTVHYDSQYIDGMGMISGKKKEDALMLRKGDELHSFVLAEGKVYAQIDGFYAGVDADSISKTEDGKLVVKSGSKVKVFDVNAGTSKEYTIDATGNEPVKSAVFAGNMMYYATAKKLGYKTIGQ